MHDPLAVPEEPPASRVPSLWRNRDYMILWSGQTVSAVGTQVARLSFPLLILAITRSPVQAGIAGALNSIPYVLLALLAGALADRWDRKRVMIVCDTVRTIAFTSIPLAAGLGHLSLVQIYVVALAEGTFNVFFDLAETAAIPRVVTPEQLPAAMAQNNVMFSLSSLIGQPLGGVLFQIGRSIPFLVDAVSYAVSVVSIFFIRTRFQAERTAPAPGLQTEIREGFTWLWAQPLIRFMAFFNAGIWVAFAGGPLLVIVIARHQHAPTAAIGLITAGIGVGGMAGSVLIPRVQARFSFATVVVGGVLLTALLWTLYAVAPDPLALGGLAAASSLVFTVYNVVQMSYRLALIPDELQGRVNSIFRLIAFTGQPIGMLLTGALLQVAGIPKTVVFGTVWLLLLAVVSALTPAVRRMNRPGQGAAHPSSSI